MMKIFIPNSYFLRVDDKFIPKWLAHDRQVKSGPDHLYTVLFRLARKCGVCTPKQDLLAYLCKCTVRTIQNRLKKLVLFEYIQVTRDPDGRCRYTLLLSPRLEEIIQRSGIVFHERGRAALPAARSADVPHKAAPVASVTVPAVVSDASAVQQNAVQFTLTETTECPLQASAGTPKQQLEEAKNLRPLGDLFSRPFYIEDLRDLRDQDLTPLSPLAVQSPVPSPHRAPVRGECFTSHLSAPRAQDSPAHSATAPSSAASGDFERLWQAWPVKKSKLFASRVFASLARARKLPPIQALLAVVEHFKRTDRHWLNGYAPQLVWWLKGCCWTDEPVLVPAFAGTDSIGPQAVPGWMQAEDIPDWMRDPASIQARVQEVRNRFGLRG